MFFNNRFGMNHGGNIMQRATEIIRVNYYAKKQPNKFCYIKMALKFLKEHIKIVHSRENNFFIQTYIEKIILCSNYPTIKTRIDVG